MLIVKNGLPREIVNGVEYMTPFDYAAHAPELPDGEYITFTLYTRDPHIGHEEFEDLKKYRLDPKYAGEVDCEGMVCVAFRA